MEQKTERTRGTKRKVLVVEDNELNREILTAILEEQYDVLTAENGQEGIEVLSQNYGELSLVLLDVYMPICDGFEFLRRTQCDSLLSSVPVIVATGSDKAEDEVTCLHLGASDFVTKPYNPDVVLARVHSIIKLKESVATLSAVEFDSLTGVYTMQAFYHYVQQVLTSERDSDFSMAVLNLQNFKLVNSVYGEQTGNQVLQYLADTLREQLPEAICARQEDKFFILAAVDTLPELTALPDAVNRMLSGAPVARLTGKVGLIRHVDAGISVQILCDHALLAASTIKNRFAENVACYDEALQKRMLEEQRLENSFDAALANEEFAAWYQPKVDPQTGNVEAAEALVRWIPEPGKMVSPGMFIPLFERDGLVSRLDEYMFRTVCRFQHERLQEKKKVVPISINLSRNSIYRPGTVETYSAIAEQLGVDKALVPIELTESASIDGKEVLELMQKFSAAGFSLHMDDFGTGYSSLSSLTDMPFDVVKLDKSLIDRIGSSKGDTIIRHMIRIAQELGMELVAEGVETADQLEFLKEAGINLIQGYYYSPPKDQIRFETILECGF